MGTLDDHLALNNENDWGFPSEPIRSTPIVALPLSSAIPVARLARDAPALAVCCPELSFKHFI